jgi:probable F420-dependent oxidoreductase
LRFSFVIFGVRSDHSTALVRRAESLGFDAVWFGDHVVTPIRIDSPYPYTASGSAGYSADTPLNDVWVSIAHAAAVTTTIKLGPSVLILPLRHPAVVAQAAVTAQNMSGGRVVLGVGAGWLREEFDALGVPFETRGSRMDDALEIMRELWTGREVASDGAYFSFAPVKLGMTPVSPIPVTVGGASLPALRRAARCDGWNGPEVPLDVAIRHREHLLQLRSAAGREGQPFRIYAKPPGIEPAVLRAYRDAGFEDLVVPFRALYSGRPLTLADQLAALERLADAIMLPDLVAGR